MDSTQHHGKQDCYVLTHDLGHRIETLRDLGLKTPNHDDPFYTALKAGLEQRIRAIYPNAEIKSLSMHDLVQKIWTEAIRKQSSIKDAVIVSTTYDVANPRRGHTLEINRIFNLQGEQIGFGPRPGNPSLDEQIQSLSVLANGNPVVLAEDGAFSGKTIVYILEQFKARRLPVSTVVLGFSSEEGIDTIKKAFDGDIITIEGVPHLIDWMPDHDFIPFAPNCGRVFGIPFGKEAHPIYTHDGAAFAIPYVRPFGDLKKWGSIPAEQVNEFSLYCCQQALELFTRIERMSDNHFVTIRDLMGTRPSVCIPISFDSDSFPRLDARVTDYLSDTCHFLA